MARLFSIASLGLLAFGQQPEQAHLSLTGNPHELALDFFLHDSAVGCNRSVGVQIGTSPDFTAASFIPAYNCTDFTSFESAP